MKKIDMSSDAVTRRLKQTEQLRKLSLSLMKATRLTKTEAAALREKIKKNKLIENFERVDQPEQD